MASESDKTERKLALCKEHPDSDGCPCTDWSAAISELAKRCRIDMSPDKLKRKR